MSMNDDIKKYGVKMLYNGKLYPADWVQNTDSYNHYLYQLHHFIKQQSYKRNEQRYKEQGIKQKLILLPVQCHLDLHNCISDFEQKWKIKRSELLYGARF